METTKKKMGRPTTNPRPLKLTVRVNKATKTKLENYCKENNLSTADAIEKAIKNL